MVVMTGARTSAAMQIMTVTTTVTSAYYDSHNHR
ncbi:uncharacterized protein G2W53_040912 [Senna tora]|uniref:Uncharacterized protein n=1 Tax=Senna tora TaxID=362788 RepID=A0A834W0W1_9FABA|nr:uncharacterized protein G2W53_040912 [Senna tora]